MKKGLKIIIVIVVAIILVSTAFLVLYHPTHAFTDTSQTAAPEQLDPATGFFSTNGPLFAAVFQTLVEFNGSSTSVVPVLASNVYNVNDTHYTFDIRSYANFSNGQQLNASSVWFSFARGILMGQGPYAADYSGILFNGTMSAVTGVTLPNGTMGALENAGYTIPHNAKYKINGKTVSNQLNYTVAGNDLADILSHFNYNKTDMKVMEYKNQSLVVNSNDNITINTVHKYAYLLQDIAGWWGDIVEPSYVDAHGGVQANTQNSYANANGIIGSGPYVISSVGKGFSTIVLKANPDYWVNGHNSSVPSIAQPAHIKTVVIDYGLSHADRLEDFDKGISQISVVGPASFKQMIDGFHNTTERNSKLVHSYKRTASFYISMNVAYNYTNNTHFREALYDALNYSAELGVYNNNFNGTAEAYNELGPLSPVYGNNYYNPDGFSMPAQNLIAAVQNLTMAASEFNGTPNAFYVTLPNGTHIGDYPHGKDLSASSNAFDITYISPSNPTLSAQLTIAIDSFKQIGIAFASSGVTESDVSTWSTNTSTPQFVDLGWGPDYPDPIGQQLIPIYSPADGGAFGGNDAWVNNGTLNHYFTNLDFENATTQIHNMKNVSRIVYGQYAYMWLPIPNDVFFVAPDVHGFVFHSLPYLYFYNLMTVTGKLTSSVGFLTIYTLVVSIEMAFTNAVPKF